MKTWLVAALAVGTVVAASGCGTKDDPVTPDPGPQWTYPDKSAYCVGRARAECNATVVSKCGSAGEASCVTKRQYSICNAAQAGTYRPQAADACIAAVKAAYADAQLNEADQKSMDAACLKVFGGTGGVGAPCTDLTTCTLDQSLSCVVPNGSTTGGTCQKPVTKPGGDPCSAPDAVCDDTRYCSITEKACVLKKASGDPCHAAQPCQKTDRCVPNNPPDTKDPTIGTCQTKLANNSPCASAGECASGMCVTVVEWTGDGGSPVTQTKCMDYQGFSASEPICQEYK
jgi:hypothetical protein